MILGQNAVANSKKFHLRSLFHNYYSDWTSNQLDDGDDNHHIRSGFAFDQHSMGLMEELDYQIMILKNIF
jgi:hypothetical protein